jgi:hypothetical protein
MKYRILIVAVLFAGTFFLWIALAAPAFGQRDASRGDVVMSGRSNRGPGESGIPGAAVDIPSAPRNPNAELQLSEKLAARLKTLLPQDVDPHRASKGFDSLKDFVITVRSSNNLGIPFPELKHQMADGSFKALQKAIHELKPDVDPKAELKKAGEQAKQDIRDSK